MTSLRLFPYLANNKSNVFIIFPATIAMDLSLQSPKELKSEDDEDGVGVLGEGEG